MENNYIDVQYQQMTEVMESSIYKLATDIATKEGAKSQSKNDVTKQAVAYIVKELAIKGSLFNVTTADLVIDSKSCKTYINASIRALVNKGLIERYKMTSKTSTGATKTRKGQIVYSKTNYTLVIKEELVDLLAQYGFDINFDKALIPQMHINAAKEVSSKFIVNTTQYSIPVTKEYTTIYDGSRTVVTSANNSDIENAIEECKTRINELEELKENNGKEIEISPVNPLVSQEVLNNIDNEEFKAEQASYEEIVEENLEVIPSTDELEFDDFDGELTLEDLLANGEDMELEDESVENNSESVEASSNEIVEENLEVIPSTVEIEVVSEDNIPNDLDDEPEAKQAEVTLSNNNGKQDITKIESTHTEEEPKHSNVKRNLENRKDRSKKPVPKGQGRIKLAKKELEELNN